MKTISALIFALMLVGCNSVEQESRVASSPYTGPRAWNSAVFPIDVKISQDFTATERTLLQSMGTNWEDSLSNRIDFFDLTGTTPEINVSDSDNLADNIFGIYKSQSWSPDFSSGALAVTQIYMSRYISGQIAHADIAINYSGSYTFRTGLTGSGYDLGTVVLHELGHFVGLDHSSGVTRLSSVMYPDISLSENKRTPQSYDQTQLGEKYPSQSGSSFALRGEYRHENPLDSEVVITLELMPSGECFHKQNGKTVHKHNLPALIKH